VEAHEPIDHTHHIDHDGAEPDDAWDVVVVGGSLAGLLAATMAAGVDPAEPSPGQRAEPRPRVALVEPHPLGGRARVDRRDGFAFNRGPRALYVGGIAHRLLEDLGVDVTHGGPPSMVDAGAVAGGRLHRFPGRPIDAARTTLLGARDKVALGRAVARIARSHPDDGAGLTLDGWLDQQGLAGRARQVVEALVRVSTYANAPDRLDARFALANARLGMTSGVRYLDGGWQSLVDQLRDRAVAAGVELVADEVVEVAPVPGEATAPAPVSAAGGAGGREASGPRWRVRARGRTLRATAVVLATGGPDRAAALLGGRPSSWGEPGPEAAAACLELGLRRPPAHRFVLGIDEPTYLSTHAPPARLAPEGGAVVHVMRYLAPGEDRPRDQARAELRALARLAGVDDDDVVVERFLARMVVTAALPTPDRPRPAVEVAEHPGVVLAGDWVGGAGLLLDAVAASAAEAGRRAAAWAATGARRATPTPVPAGSAGPAPSTNERDERRSTTMAGR
jgi:phytoene dehydrogenase-like protein